MHFHDNKREMLGDIEFEVYANDTRLIEQALQSFSNRFHSTAWPSSKKETTYRYLQYIIYKRESKIHDNNSNFVFVIFALIF